MKDNICYIAYCFSKKNSYQRRWVRYSSIYWRIIASNDMRLFRSSIKGNSYFFSYCNYWLHIYMPNKLGSRDYILYYFKFFSYCMKCSLCIIKLKIIMPITVTTSSFSNTFSCFVIRVFKICYLIFPQRFFVGQYIIIHKNTFKKYIFNF